MISWSSWSSFQADLKAEMILPYASRGVLYAAKLSVGWSGSPVQSAAASAGSLPHADEQGEREHGSETERGPAGERGAERHRGSFRSNRDVRRPPVAVGRSPVVRSTERTSPALRAEDVPCMDTAQEGWCQTSRLSGARLVMIPSQPVRTERDASRMRAVTRRDDATLPTRRAGRRRGPDGRGATRPRERGGHPAQDQVRDRRPRRAGRQGRADRDGGEVPTPMSRRGDPRGSTRPAPGLPDDLGP